MTVPPTVPPAPGPSTPEGGFSDRSPADLLEVAMKVAQRAAELVAGAGRPTGALTKSSATDMVTEVDRASEDLIVADLLAAFPEDGILAEEGGGRPGSSGVRWVIDPLDGTTNFLYGFGSWAVSVAAEEVRPGGPAQDAGDPVDRVLAGVVVDIPRGETFAAARGGGAHRDGVPVRCSAATDPATSLVATGFSYSAAERGRQGRVVAGLLPQVRDVRRAGAAALDLCSVACGRVDAYFERGLSWWDHAAGARVAREAGARVGPLPGEKATLGSALAAPSGLFDALSEILAAHGA
jgi:myo-inositol-1(or 4)-monophosphatase